ncbi:dTDP-glucose 4,6-dehydratase [bacterium]|nr:MAG: dTDP-glucose 4,6-dehydratase [bacterium]
MTNKILITGAAGFIGSNFVRYILAEGDYDEIVVLDALTYAGNMDNLEDAIDDPRLTFIRGDIADAEMAFKAMDGCRYVVNFAAETHVDRSLSAANPFLHTNIMGTYVLLETARKTRPEKFLHISTDEVYGPMLNGSATEDSPLRPSSPYSASKVSADALCNAYRVSFDVPTLLARPANNYGPYQYPEKLIPFFVKRAVAGESLPVYGDGRQQRDWLHVLDNCRAIKLIIEKGKPGDIYNIGADNHHQNIDITRKILKILGLPESRIEFVTDRPGHDFRYAIDSTRIKSLGWEPQIPFEDGFADTVNWFAGRFGGAL